MFDSLNGLHDLQLTLTSNGSMKLEDINVTLVDISAFDLYRRSLRHEFQACAGIGMDLWLPGVLSIMAIIVVSSSVPPQNHWLK